MQKWISIFLISLLVSVINLSAETKCPDVCKRFIECTAEMNPGKKITEADRKKGDAGCMNTCKKKNQQTAMISCYDSSKDSCQNFAICVQNAYNSAKK